MKQIKLMIQGMHCKSCSMLIEDALDDIGVKSNINSDTGFAEIEFNELKTSIDQIKDVIKKEGYSIVGGD